MVSRRKILSRSTDDLNIEAPGLTEHEEEDVWFNKERLYKVLNCCVKVPPFSTLQAVNGSILYILSSFLIVVLLCFITLRKE